MEKKGKRGILEKKGKKGIIGKYLVIDTALRLLEANMEGGIVQYRLIIYTEVVSRGG